MSRNEAEGLFVTCSEFGLEPAVQVFGEGVPPLVRLGFNLQIMDAGTKARARIRRQAERRRGR